MSEKIIGSTKVAQFSFENGWGLHAMQEEDVYFLSPSNKIEISKHDVCLVVLVKNVFNLRRDGRYFHGYHVDVLKVEISKKEVDARNKKMKELQRDWGKDYPSAIFAQERQFISGQISADTFESIVRKHAWGLT